MFHVNTILTKMNFILTVFLTSQSVFYHVCQVHVGDILCAINGVTPGVFPLHLGYFFVFPVQVVVYEPLRMINMECTMDHGAFHVDHTPNIFFKNLLLHHDKTNLEMMWPSHTLRPS